MWCSGLSPLCIFTAVLVAIKVDGCPTHCTCQLRQVSCTLSGSSWKEIPQDLPTNLTDLTVTRSHIPILRSGDLRRYINLRRLIFQFNSKLSTLQPYFLQTLTNLTLFSCSNSSALVRLDRFAFSGIRALGVKIYLENNQIREIASHAFQNSRGIRKLSLDANPIKKISKNAFTGLYMTDFLHLPSGIEVIEPDAFKNFTRVHVFDLKEPKLKILETHTFRGLKSVRKVTISGGNIGTWHSSAFGGVETVHEIHLTNIRIRKMKKRALAAMKNVGLFVIKGNRLKRVDRMAFKHNSADRLRVENNRLACSCHNMWLLKENSQKLLPTDFLRNNYCDSPIQLKKRALSDISHSYTESCKKNPKRSNSNQPSRISPKASSGISIHIPLPPPVILFILDLFRLRLR